MTIEKAQLTSSSLRAKPTPVQVGTCTALAASCLYLAYKRECGRMAIAASLLPSTLWLTLMVSDRWTLRAKLEAIDGSNRDDYAKRRAYRALLKKSRPGELLRMRGDEQLLSRIFTLMDRVEFSRKSLIKLMDRATCEQELNLFVELIDGPGSRELIEAWMAKIESRNLIGSIATWRCSEHRSEAYLSIPLHVAERLIESPNKEALEPFYDDLKKTEEGCNYLLWLHRGWNSIPEQHRDEICSKATKHRHETISRVPTLRLANLPNLNSQSQQ